MCEKIYTDRNEETCGCLYDSFAHVFYKVAHIRATPSRLQRLVSLIQRIMCESSYKKDEICVHHASVGEDRIATLMVDCLCYSRAPTTLDTSEIQSSRVDLTSTQDKYQSTEVILRCMYALSHVLRQCKPFAESPFMTSFVNVITCRSEEIGHAIGKIPPEHVYESTRIERILYLWRQERVLKGTGVVEKLLAWHAKIDRGKKDSNLLEQDIFERRMKHMEYASSHVMYMKHPLLLCE